MIVGAGLAESEICVCTGPAKGKGIEVATTYVICDRTSTGQAALRLLLATDSLRCAGMKASTSHRTVKDPTSVPFPQQDENGVDLSLIRENLKLTPTERVRRADRFRRGLVESREHVQRIR